MSDRFIEYLEQHPWAETDDLENEVEGRARELRKARQRLENAGHLTSTPVRHPGTPRKGNTLEPQSTSGIQPRPALRDTPGRPPVTSKEPRPTVPPP
jgi:hypothetical protein